MFLPADIDTWSRILAAPEPETRRQRIARWLHLPVTPAPTVARAHHVSQPFLGTERRREQLLREYADDYVARVLYAHRTGEQIVGPVRKSRVRVAKSEPARVLAMKARA
jgi:hypothetical protein